MPSTFKLILLFTFTLPIFSSLSQKDFVNDVAKKFSDVKWSEKTFFTLDVTESKKDDLFILGESEKEVHIAYRVEEGEIMKMDISKGQLCTEFKNIKLSSDRDPGKIRADEGFLQRWGCKNGVISKECSARVAAELGFESADQVMDYALGKIKPHNVLILEPGECDYFYFTWVHEEKKFKLFRN